MHAGRSRKGMGWSVVTKKNSMMMRRHAGRKLQFNTDVRIYRLFMAQCIRLYLSVMKTTTCGYHPLRGHEQHHLQLHRYKGWKIEGKNRPLCQ